VEATTGLRVDGPATSLGAGGGFASCQRWESAAGPLFVKVAPAAQVAMLEAEADGLRELATPRAVRVPAVLGVGAAGRQAFLALEWIDLRHASAFSETQLGEQLAKLHRTTAAAFGWSRDNTIGATPQRNPWTADWATFFAQHRLGFQFDLVERHGRGRGRDATDGISNRSTDRAGGGGRLIERGRRLCERIGRLLADHRPVPSLLHGDLWGGNWAADGSDAPVIFDPAVYYGDREADLAMTRLFGGFGRGFYDAYESAWPLPPGAELRRTLYNLYHVLNHHNLFGGGYGAQAEAMIERLLAET
jgi:fructosamine-3-kinase